MQTQPDPFVSFIVPTLNSAATLPACLEAIRALDYPRDRMEIVIADAGSRDATPAIARSLGANTVVPNPLRTGEAGKAAAIAASHGDVLALVDSDNVLDSPQWLRRMLQPLLADPDIHAAEPLWYTCRPGDPPLTRYFSLLGMNDPLCLFLGNYDRLSLVTGRWTDLPVPVEDRGDYLKLTLSETALPTIGANGFVLRRSLLANVNWSPYFFDIDVVHQAVAAGHPHVAKVRCGIVHLFAGSLRDFARKQNRRVADYLFFSREGTRSFPWRRSPASGIARFCLATLSLAPLLVQVGCGWRRRPDPAWLLHLPACWITLLVYGTAVLRKGLGLPPKPVSRDAWQRRR